MKELVAWYKANPAKANFGSPAPGSLPHFFGLMIGKGAGVDLIHVPYNGGAPMMNGLMGDQVSSGIDTTVEMIELHRAGKIRILGTSGATRSPLLPEVPTLVESGLAGVEGTELVRGLRAGEDARGRRCASSTPRSTRRSPRPRCASASPSSASSPPAAAPPTWRSGWPTTRARWGPIVKASGFKAD